MSTHSTPLRPCSVSIFLAGSQCWTSMSWVRWTVRPAGLLEEKTKSFQLHMSSEKSWNSPGGMRDCMSYSHHTVQLHPGSVILMMCLIFDRFGGGLWLDIKRKIPWYCSDIYDGFHIQSISAVLFIYLGCITNAITFGGLLGDATDNYQVSIMTVIVNQSRNQPALYLTFVLFSLSVSFPRGWWRASLALL